MKMEINQELVEAILKRAEDSAFGLEKSERNLSLDTYAQKNLDALAMLLIGGWHGKYELISVVAAALTEVTSRLERENQQLQRWKDEALTVESWWQEIDTFVRKHPGAPLGVNVAATALEWLKERDTLKAAKAKD